MVSSVGPYRLKSRSTPGWACTRSARSRESGSPARLTVRAEAGSRAIAGLSMGGGQTLRVVVGHPDQFAYVGVWSAGIGPPLAADFEKRAATFLNNADKVNGVVKLFSISVGHKDFTFAGSKNLAAVLNKHGIKNELRVSGGGHTWINWRHYLHHFAQQLFR